MQVQHKTRARQNAVMDLSTVTTSRRPRIIAAVPCFNTKPSIGEIIARAKRCVDQVVVIDDGSHDNTDEVAKAAGAKVVKHNVNQGYGRAIISCFAAARAEGADVLIILDGDGQHNPDEIPNLLAPVLGKEADLVIGSRFIQPNGHGPGSVVPVTNMPRYRKFGIKVITSLFNIGAKSRVTDTQSGFRAYGPRALKALHLNEKGMSISIEILAQARKAQLVIKEVPISCRYFEPSISRKAIRHGLKVALNVLRIRLMHFI